MYMSQLRIAFFSVVACLVLIYVTRNQHITTYLSNDVGESVMVRMYLDIVRDTVCGLTLRSRELSVRPGIKGDKTTVNLNKRISGLDWPWIGITMIGQIRLKNIEWALRLVISNNVPGDFVECGVWRGGASIFARAILKALKIHDRHVWLVDSFQGLPRARTYHDSDKWSKYTYLQVSLEEVQTNFRSFYLLDDHVHFCKGYFVDSLPKCNVSQISVLRMDGDMYESTMDQLFNLYQRLQVGGVIIIDDYSITECQRAIHDFRNWHNIIDEIIRIDVASAYWIKSKQVELLMNHYSSLLTSKKKSDS